MPDHPNQPQEYDAVLGGQTPIPTGSAILGGIEGVKRRLASQFEEQRIAALSEALKYGEAGLDLVIWALRDESIEVEKAAYLLLRERTDPRVKQALQEYNPWRFFECLRTLWVHSSSVKSVAISPGGQTLVSRSFNKTIKSNLQTGKLKRTFRGHLWIVNSVAISPDEETLVSASTNNTLEVWNLYTQELLRTLVGHNTGYSNGVESVAISPDGQTLVSGNWDKTITVWNLHTGELKKTLTGHSDTVNFVAISPNGQTLISGSDDHTIKIWHLQTGELIRTLPQSEELITHSRYKSPYGGVKSIAISQDWQTLIGGSWDNTIKVWHLQTGELIKTLQETGELIKTLQGYPTLIHRCWVNTVAISPDGQTIVSGSGDKTIKVWNLHTEELKRTLEGHSGVVNSVAISPDGQTIVSGGNDKTIKIWGIP